MTGYFLSVEEQSFIVGMNTSGASLSEIANVVRKSKKSISLVLKRYRERGSIQIAKRSGRPKKLQEIDRRVLKYEIVKNCRIPLAELASSLPIPVSMNTIQKEVHDLGFGNRIAKKKPFLNERHKKLRLAFAKEHKHWTVEQWKLVIWSDESSFEIGAYSRQTRVWRTTSQKFHLQCLAPTFKFGRMSIMVWGAFTATSKCFSILIPFRQRTAMNFVEIVCEQGLLPYFYHHANHEELEFMLDGAPIHTARVTKNCIKRYWFKDAQLASKFS